MTYLPLEIPPGVVRGANPDDAPGRWYDSNLVRWRDGRMEPVGGWSRLTSSPFDAIPRRVHQWRTNDNLLQTIVGTDAKLHSYDDGNWTDVSPGGLQEFFVGGSGFGAGPYGDSTYGTPRASGITTLSPKRPMWSFANWGEDVLIVNSSDGRLLFLDASTPGDPVRAVGEFDIATISRTANVTTVVTVQPHQLTSGRDVAISGVTGTGFDTASASVTVTNSTTFTYSNTGSNGSGSGGTVTDNTIPTGNRAILVTPERHAIALQVDGNPFRLGWCSREDFFDWVFASDTNTAGYLDLHSDTPLFQMCSVREGTLIWSESDVFLLRYVGLPFIYGYDDLGSSSLYAPLSFAEFDGRCVWMDQQGFKLYDGGTVRPMACPVADYIFSDIDPLQGPRKAWAERNGVFPEVWFHYPSLGAQECDRFVIWNYKEDWWSIGSLARSAGTPAKAGPKPLFAGSDGHLYQHEDGWSYDGFDPTGIYAESAVINAADTEASVSVSQIVPSNGGNYELTSYTIYSRMTPNGAERIFGPYNSRSDGYVDCRAIGRDLRIRINARDGGDWSIGRLRMKVGSAMGGRR